MISASRAPDARLACLETVIALRRVGRTSNDMTTRNVADLLKGFLRPVKQTYAYAPYACAPLSKYIPALH